MKYKYTNVIASWTYSLHHQIVLIVLAKNTCLTIKFSQGFHKFICIRFELYSCINNVSMNTCRENTPFFFLSYLCMYNCIYIGNFYSGNTILLKFFFNNLWMYYPYSISLSPCMTVTDKMVTFGGEECYKSSITVCKSVGTGMSLWVEACM